MKSLLYTLVITLSFGSLANGQSLQPCRSDSGLFGYCNSQGEVVIEQKFYDALDFVDGHAAVLMEDKWGIINESGNWMVEPRYDEVYDCANIHDQILVKEGENWSFVVPKP